VSTEPSPQRVKDDASFSEFDGTRFLVEYVKEEDGSIESNMRISLSGKAIAALKGADMDELLEAQYSGMLSKPADGYQVAVQFNMDTVEGDKEAFARKVSLLKHFSMGAPLYKQFKALAVGSVPSSPPIEIHHRPTESYWIINAGDKVIVSHSMHFVDDDERVVAELVLKGFNFDHKTGGSAPGVMFSDQPPAELKQKGIAAKEGASDWLTATYFSNHVQGEEKLLNAVAQAQNLRTFIAYHTKAAKTYMSNKMRTRIEYFQKVLDRAVPAKEAQKGTANLMAVGVAGKLLEGVKKRRAGK